VTGRPHDTVVIGVAGAGKTAYAIDLVERAVRNGMNPMKIGFCSFSRAACAEAAERVEKITGIRKDELQKQGWFRTIHSAALKCLGLSSDCILDHDSKSGQDWMNVHCISHRGSRAGREKGSLQEIVDTALTLWDNHRSLLVIPARSSFVPNDENIDLYNKRLTSTKTGDYKRAKMCKKQGVDSFTSKFPRATPGCDTRDTPATPQIRQGVDTFTNENAVQLRKCVQNSTYTGEVEIIKETRKPEKGVAGVAPSRIRSKNIIESVDTLGVAGVSQNGGVVSHDMATELTCSLPMSPIVRHAVKNGQSGGYEGQVWTNTFVCRGEQREIVEKYEEAKKIWGKLDFTDLLLAFAGVTFANCDEFCVGKTLADAQTGVSLWFFDEYQDCSPLLDLCAERLSEAAGERLFLGDRFQCVFDWSCATSLCVAHREAEADSHVLLNRTWRNPEQVVDWGEDILTQDPEYVSRAPVSEWDGGTVGLMEQDEFERLLGTMGKADVMILARTWYTLARVKALLDAAGCPWMSMSEKYASPWNAPARLAYTLVMRDLAAGEKISEHDWRRVTEELPAKTWFVRGTKARWKKIECSMVASRTVDELADWGATPEFVELVRSGAWAKGLVGNVNDAIERFGVQDTRRPRTRLGTAHSAKGTEADHVFCIAKSSAACDDPDICLKYVTITRAKINYRLVVDPFDVARNNPLFWAAPRDAQFVQGIDLRDSRINAQEELPETGEGQVERCLDRQDPWVTDADTRDAGPDPLRSGEVPRDRAEEEQRREGGKDTGSDGGSDLEMWWDI